MNHFITFDGIEGCGKSSQIALAEAWLKKRGIAVWSTAEPGGTPLGRKIRDILLNRGAWSIGPEAELLLFAAARAQHVSEAIRPALERGEWVLCDRFADATVAYQGFGRGLDTGFIRTLNDFSARSLAPRMTLLFDLPVELGLARAKRRAAGVPTEKAEDRFEQEERAFHERIREGYLALAATEPDRFRVIDGARAPEAVHRDVCRCLETLIVSGGGDEVR